MSIELYLAFVAASVALALLPGPIVTLVIANGLRHGTRAALTNIAGVEAEAPPPPRGGFFLQGFLVALSNPKLLVFFGAFIPQFVDLSQDHLSQVTLLGVTFMVIAALTDATYALLAGRVRRFFSARRTRTLSRVSGSFMIGGGIWLALTRAR